MATIKHAKVSSIPDGADSTQVRPSDWNAAHTIAGLVTSDMGDVAIGDWTPVITFTTPGDSNWTPSSNAGKYVRMGQLVLLSFRATGTMSHSSASGALAINGLPFASRSLAGQLYGPLWTSGFDGVAGEWTQALAYYVAGTTQMQIALARFTGAAGGVVGTWAVPSGGTIDIRGGGAYIINA